MIAWTTREQGRRAQREPVGALRHLAEEHLGENPKTGALSSTQPTRSAGDSLTLSAGRAVALPGLDGLRSALGTRFGIDPDGGGGVDGAVGRGTPNAAGVLAGSRDGPARAER